MEGGGGSHVTSQHITWHLSVQNNAVELSSIVQFSPTVALEIQELHRIFFELLGVGFDRFTATLGL